MYVLLKIETTATPAPSVVETVNRRNLPLEPSNMGCQLKCCDDLSFILLFYDIYSTQLSRDYAYNSGQTKKILDLIDLKWQKNQTQNYDKDPDGKLTSDSLFIMCFA